MINNIYKLQAWKISIVDFKNFLIYYFLSKINNL